MLSKEGQILSGDHWTLDALRVKHYGWLELVSLLFEISRHNDICSCWLSVCMPAWWYKYLLTGVWPVALFILIQMHSLQNVLHKLPRLFLLCPHRSCSNARSQRSSCSIGTYFPPSRMKHLMEGNWRGGPSESLFVLHIAAPCSFGLWAHRKLCLASKNENVDPGSWPVHRWAN